MSLTWSAIKRISHSGGVLSAILGLALFANLPKSIRELDPGAFGSDLSKEAARLLSLAETMFLLALVVYVFALVLGMRMPGAIADHESEISYANVVAAGVSEGLNDWANLNREAPVMRFFCTIFFSGFFLLIAIAAALGMWIPYRYLETPRDLVPASAQSQPRLKTQQRESSAPLTTRREEELAAQAVGKSQALPSAPPSRQPSSQTP